MDYEEQQFQSQLSFQKRAFLDTELLKTAIVFRFDSEKGLFKGQLQVANLKSVFQAKEPVERELELKDLSDLPIFNVKTKVSYWPSSIEQKYLPGLVSQSTLTNYLITFKEVQLKDAYSFAARMRSVKVNETVSSEMYLVL